MNKLRHIIKSVTSAEAKGVLFRNTVLLYILQFSGYFFALATIPYQTRILGPETFGILGFAIALMVFVELFIDFGFMLHATAEVSKNRDDNQFISRLLTSVMSIKVALAVIATIAVSAAVWFIPSMHEHASIYLLFLLATIVNCFMPDFVYRGIEKMASITVRTVIVKASFTLLIFAFLKNPDQAFVVPLLMLLGNAGSIGGVYLHLHRKVNVRFVRIDRQHAVRTFIDASQFFYSRMATALYGAANTMILGVVNPGASVGYYASADKLVNAAKSVMAPIADSTYPYMIKHKDFKLIAKILKLTMPFIIAGSIATFFLADWLCALLFGEAFVGSADVLRALLPIVIVILPNYLLGFPTLGAMGLAKHANLSIFFAVGVQAVSLAALLTTGHLTMITLALAASFAEISVLLYRSYVIYRHRHLLIAPEI